jgi:hypothetical protein
MSNQTGFARHNCITVGAAVRWHDEESQLVAIVMMVDLLCLLPEQLVLYFTYRPVRITEKRGWFFPKATSQNCRVFAEKKMVWSER